MPGSPDPEIPEVTATEAWTALEKNKTAQLVDVRTRAEWSYVGVPDLSPLNKQSVLVEWQSFPSNQIDPQFVDRLSKVVAEFGDSSATELFFICRSGARSLAAARAMNAAGFTRCRNVSDGFEGSLDSARHRGHLSGWKAAGLPWIQT